MGTVMNGNVWAGACVNGKVVSGLAKDGSVFYRKPVSKYKRRIMVGDNLGGKNIYNDFKNNNSFFQEWLKTKDYSSFITSDLNTSNYDYFEFYVSSDESTFLSLTVNYPEKSEEVSIYNYANGNVTITPKVTIRDDLDYDAVTSIVESVAYRHLFIEDENIRPLEVGDVITENTKIYFIIPDNIGLNAINTMNPDKYTSNPVGFENNNVQIYGQISGSTYKVIFKASKDYTIYSSNFNNVSSNLSKFVPDSGTSFSATVSSINTDSYLYEYILVDTTTLGT